MQGPHLLSYVIPILNKLRMREALSFILNKSIDESLVIMLSSLFEYMNRWVEWSGWGSTPQSRMPKSTKLEKSVVVLSVWVVPSLFHWVWVSVSFNCMNERRSSSEFRKDSVPPPVHIVWVSIVENSLKDSGDSSVWTDISFDGFVNQDSTISPSTEDPIGDDDIEKSWEQTCVEVVLTVGISLTEDRTLSWVWVSRCIWEEMDLVLLLTVLTEWHCDEEDLFLFSVWVPAWLLCVYCLWLLWCLLGDPVHPASIVCVALVDIPGVTEQVTVSFGRIDLSILSTTGVAT